MGNSGESVDVLVIGAGASGGAFTWSLSEAGIKVMCLEPFDTALLENVKRRGKVYRDA